MIMIFISNEGGFGDIKIALLLFCTSTFHLY